MDNNLDDQTTKNNVEEGTNPSSYTDPNAGYTEADPQTENEDNVTKEVADDHLKQEEKGHTAYTYGEMHNNTYPNNSYDNGTGQRQYQDGGYNTGFNANGYNNNYNNQNNYQMPPKQLDPSPLSTGEWILTLIVGIIPCVGLILYIIWAFSNSGSLNRRNYCRASLIIQVISYVLVIFFILIVVLGGSMSYYRY